MDAKLVQRMQFGSTGIDSDKFAGRKPAGSVRFSARQAKEEQGRMKALVFGTLQASGRKDNRRSSSLEVSSSPLESGRPYFNGRCIYLVGLMGSGKTTVGKNIAQLLGYSFVDSDSLIEQSMEGTSVAEIFEHYGEAFFREKETKIIQELSIMPRQVVSTGGGAVVRRINWRYMQKGVSVWLDVPLEVLAQRIAAVGTDSRPLLDHESSDPYMKAFKRLYALSVERYDDYREANVQVSLENIAAKLGNRDVSSISPETIAREALEQIENYLEGEGDMMGL